MRKSSQTTCDVYLSIAFVGFSRGKKSGKTILKSFEKWITRSLLPIVVQYKQIIMVQPPSLNIQVVATHLSKKIKFL